MTTDTDLLQRFLFEGAGVRGEFVRLGSSFRALLDKHDYPPAIARQLGKALASVSLLSATIKLEGSLILQVQGDGPMHTLVAQADSQGGVRGLARWQGEVTHHNATLAELAGRGHIVMTVDADGSERYQGIVELHEESLAETLREYFLRSEQLPTRIWLASQDDLAAGLLLQKLPEGHGPEASWEHLVTLSDTITGGELLELPFSDLLNRLYHQETVRLFDAEPVAFRCSCSREKIERVLLGLGRQEVDSILEEEGEICADCEFCLGKYRFDRVDVAALFADAMPPSGRQ
jgi:molecular chaperone Hsp33